MTEIVANVLNKFQELKGNMSLYCFDTDTKLAIICAMANKFRAKRPDSKIFVVVEDYSERMEVINMLDKNGFNNITVITAKYVNPYYDYCYDLAIMLSSENMDVLRTIKKGCKFCCVIITSHIDNQQQILQIRNIFPDSGINIKKQSNLTKPVEGIVHTVSLTEDDAKLYEEYNDYVVDSIKIFGDIDMINNCRSGSANKSAATYRDELARINGWSNTMDTNIEFYKAIDDMYNPNALYDRACNFFSIANKRKKLLTDNKAKLHKILDLVNKLLKENKRILIVSKTDEFANDVSKMLNDNNINCGDYHDNIPDAIAVDNNGKPILIKSGINKGKPKIIKSQAISTHYEAMYNAGNINVLSIKSSSNSKLKIACDVVLFTTSLQPNILEFKTRFNNVKINGLPNEIYYIICDTIMENNALIDNANLPFVKIENFEQKNVQFSENNLDIIL